MGSRNDLLFVWTPLDLSNRRRVPKAFALEFKSIQASHLIHEYLIGLSAKCKESATWADFNRGHFVRVRNLSHRLLIVYIPEQNWRSLACSDQLQLTVYSLGHAAIDPVCYLPRLNALLLLEVIAADRLVRRARVDHMVLLAVGKQRHNIFLLIYQSKLSVFVNDLPVNCRII